MPVFPSLRALFGYTPDGRIFWIKTGWYITDQSFDEWGDLDEWGDEL